jgi:hypothetical protein
MEIFTQRAVTAYALVKCILFVSTLSALPRLSMAQAPMAPQAQNALRSPLLVDVKPVAQQTAVGGQVRVQVSLLDGEGHPAKAMEDYSVRLRATQPSGKTSETLLSIPSGTNSQEVLINSEEAGLIKLEVSQIDNKLLSGTNYALIVPRAPTSIDRRKKKPQSKKSTDRRLKPGPISRKRSTRLVLAALQEDLTSAQSPTEGPPQLLLKVSGENDAQGVRADGKAFARVQIFWIGQPAPSSAVQIWLTWTNGELEPNPILLKKGMTVGEARWRSTASVPTASVSVVATNPPHLPFVGPTEAKVRFAEPILGIDFANPPDKITVVDIVPLTARFYDPAGFPIQTETKRHFRFASNNPILHLNPQEDDIAPGRSDFSTMMLPTSLGMSRIEVSTPGYKPVIHDVRVTGTLVVLLSVVGGILGGFLAYINSQGKLWIRIVTGIIVGLVASWAYVFVGLPNTDKSILHSQISVVFVSVLSAFSGVKVLGGIAGALKFGF